MSIEISNLQFGYYEDGKNTIDGADAVFAREKVTVLTGKSGCGKSTLLYLAAGIYPSNAGFLRGGSVHVEGEDPAVMTPPVRCRKVGMMFQNPDLQFCMDTVRNELIFTAENIAVDPAEIPARIAAALAFAEIEYLENRRLNTLSGGEKQKVMLACLYLLDPAWMLLDEAFANVDDASAKQILGKLLRLHEEKGTGLLVVDHRLEHWWEIADEICLMEEGKIAMTVCPRDEGVKESLQAAGVQVGRDPYPGIAVLRESVQEDSTADGDSDRPVFTPDTDVPALTLSHLSVSHEKGHPVLTDINATFYKGGIYAIVGQSGCGKSSLFGALSGLYKYEGSALLGGAGGTGSGQVEIRRMKRADFGRLGFVTQSPQDQFLGGTVRQEVMAAFKKDPDAEARSEQILRHIGLWKYRDVSPYLLSQGQQRRLGVAALMAYPCEVLVCDEPTYAQDRENTIAIMASLCKGAAQRGATMLFSTHDRQLAEDYADKIYTLEGGTLHE